MPARRRIPSTGHDLPQRPLGSSTPAPLNLASLRAIAAIPGAELPPDMLAAMRATLVSEGSGQLVRELETLFDLATGRVRTI